MVREVQRRRAEGGRAGLAWRWVGRLGARAGSALRCVSQCHSVHCWPPRLAHHTQQRILICPILMLHTNWAFMLTEVTGLIHAQNHTHIQSRGEDEMTVPALQSLQDPRHITQHGEKTA